MSAEVKYVSGPEIIRTNDSPARVLRGDAVMWVQVGVSDRLRPVNLTNEQLVHLALQCLLVLKQRS